MMDILNRHIDNRYTDRYRDRWMPLTNIYLWMQIFSMNTNESHDLIHRHDVGENRVPICTMILINELSGEVQYKQDCKGKFIISAVEIMGKFLLQERFCLNTKDLSKGINSLEEGIILFALTTMSSKIVQLPRSDLRHKYCLSLSFEQQQPQTTTTN